MLANILLGILVVVGIALTGIILLQRSEGGGLVSGGGGGQFMSARGTANLLTRTTQILAALFFLLAMGITVVMGRSTDTGSVVDQAQVKALDPVAMAQQQERQRQAQIAADKAKQDQLDKSGGLPGLPQAPTPSLGGAPATAPFGAAPPAADPFAPAPKR
jgi:preprotein translocase subunit SecG